MKNILILALFSTLLFFSCSPKKDIADLDIPVGIIPPDSMIAIITDMQIVEATLREYKRLGKDEDERSAKFYSQIFDKHRINSGKYKESVAFYEEHPVAYYEIYTEVLNQLTQIQTEVNDPAEEYN